MLLVIDIGNTNIVIGAMSDDDIIFRTRMLTDSGRTAGQYECDIRDIISKNRILAADIEGCVIASVVPSVLHSISECMTAVLGKRPCVPYAEMEELINIRADAPESIGRDRLASAIAAANLYKLPLIVMDLGTATTIDAVDENGSFLGGSILPGVVTALDALIDKTAQLPDIELKAPGDVVGKNTTECMQSGIMYGTAAMLDGMADRICESMGIKTCSIIATGGIAGIIAPLCRHELILEEDLVLKGLGIIYRKLNK